jgi:hypothetical protein
MEWLFGYRTFDSNISTNSSPNISRIDEFQIDC